MPVQDQAPELWFTHINRLRNKVWSGSSYRKADGNVNGAASLANTRLIVEKCFRGLF
jgi:hypothetical protein